MIIGIGCDIVCHEISRDMDWKLGSSALQRIFSEEEIKTYAFKKDFKFLSGRFAAKEAVLKCLSTGMQDGIALCDIEILQSLSGSPVVKLIGEVKRISDDKEIAIWHVSISHSTDQSMAVVVAESH